MNSATPAALAAVAVAIGGALAADKYKAQRLPILGLTAAATLLFGSVAVAQAATSQQPSPGPLVIPPFPSPLPPAPSLFLVGQQVRLPLANLSPDALPLAAVQTDTGEPPTGVLITIDGMPAPGYLDGRIVGWYIEAPNQPVSYRAATFANGVTYGPVRVAESAVHLPPGVTASAVRR